MIGKLVINSFVPITPFLYPLKTSENLTVFWCFQWVEKGCIGSEWVNKKMLLNANIRRYFYSLEWMWLDSWKTIILCSNVAPWTNPCIYLNHNEVFLRPGDERNKLSVGCHICKSVVFVVWKQETHVRLLWFKYEVWSKVAAKFC